MDAADFVGKTMTVRLHNPPSTIRGNLESLEPGKSLILIIWDAVAQRHNRLVIPAENVADVLVAPEREQPPALPAQPHAPAPASYLEKFQRPQFQQPQLPQPQLQQTQFQRQQPQQQQYQKGQFQQGVLQHQQQPGMIFPAYQNQSTRANEQPQSQPSQLQSQPAPLQQASLPFAPQHAPQHAPQQKPVPSQQPPQPQSIQRPQSSAFVDPAILSMVKPPLRNPQAPAAASVLRSPAMGPSSTTPHHATHQTFSQPTNGTSQPSIPQITVGSLQTPEVPQRALVETLESLNVRAELADEPVTPVPVGNGTEQEQEEQGVQKKTRRRNRPKRNASDTLDVEVAPAGGARTGRKAKGQGWRQTPILEDTAAFQPYKALRKTATQDGWQSEDVTDVQEAGEFDFESSLKKFDKRTVFGELQEKDKVDESDRLVSHNRVQRPKPGTAGGKNLHYTDNVLDTPANLEKPNKTLPDDFWKSEADDGARNGSERLSGRELGSRQSSRRGEGQVAAVKARSQSRKASIADVGRAPSRTNSGVSGQKPARRRHPKPKHADIEDKLPSASSSAAGFVIPQTNKRVEILSPLQMLNLENIAQNDLGLTEDMMTENAARGIAEVALHTLTDPAIRVRLAAVDGNAPEPATVVILAGNNKSGYRSVAAGRHLRNKGMHVIICVVGIEKGERDLSVDMTKQLRLFKNFGGRVVSKSELFEFVRKASMPVISMDAPRSVLPQAPPMAVTLIIDALLGHVTPFEDLRAADQATVYELIEWTNRNEAFVLAVDVPTGVDHTSGILTEQDGNSLYIRPRYVVSIGAPKKGLFEVIAAGAAADEQDNDATTAVGRGVSDDAVREWNLFLIDIGLGAAVWKRAGTKIRRGIDFGNRWALQFKYQSSATDQAEE